MCKKSHFRGPLDKEYGSRAKTLFKSERQHLYHNYSSSDEIILETKNFFSIFFFFTFRNLDSIFNIFLRKDDPHNLCIFDRTDSKKHS